MMLGPFLIIAWYKGYVPFHMMNILLIDIPLNVMYLSTFPPAVTSYWLIKWLIRSFILYKILSNARTPEDIVPNSYRVFFQMVVGRVSREIQANAVIDLHFYLRWLRLLDLNLAIPEQVLEENNVM
jgi:ABC-type uncharacterized transport system permease subunit